MTHVATPRVGLFGLLGSGNLGNDGTLEAVLGYLRTEHPDVTVDFLCAGPEQITKKYGFPAARLHWYRSEYKTVSGPKTVALKAIAKIFDAFRIAAWVRRHDVVIVPGMGVFESTLALRPWGFPYSIFLLCGFGRLFGTKVALVSIGADTKGRWLTRRLFAAAGRFAHYRSFRDTMSRDAMRDSRLDVSADEVYPDLVFALPTPAGRPVVARTVGVGVMAYRGTNDDRSHADEVRAEYVGKLKQFVRWLADNGYRIRLFIGDEEDGPVAEDVAADLRAYRPDLGPAWVVSEPVASLQDIMEQMASVELVVATRYHNVICALKMSKPTVSIGYSTKNDLVMAGMGLGDFCQSIGTLDVDRLIAQFTTLASRRGQLGNAMVERNAANGRRLEEQFAKLSATLLPPRRVTATEGTS